MTEYCSPSKEYVFEFMMKQDWWGDMCIEGRRKLVEHAMKTLEYKFGSYRGFYTFAYTAMKIEILSNIGTSVRL